MIDPAIESIVKEEVQFFLDLMKTPGRVSPDESLHFGLRFNIEVNDARHLIGEGGSNLTSLEFLIKKIVQKRFPESPNFSLDVNDYRLRRSEALRDEVKSIAKRVRMYRKEIILKPMSPFERRIIHVALAEYPDITTESVGEFRDRRVVIKPYP